MPRGRAYVQSTFNNTLITLTDPNGNVLSWASAGQSGFKGSRKSTPYAAQIAAEGAARRAMEHGLRQVDVFVKGPGGGREAAVRALQSSGLIVLEHQGFDAGAAQRLPAAEAASRLGGWQEENKNGTIYRTRLPHLPPLRRQADAEGRQVRDEVHAGQAAGAPRHAADAPAQALRPRAAAAREAEGALHLRRAREAVRRYYKDAVRLPGRDGREPCPVCWSCGSTTSSTSMGFADSLKQARQLVRHGHIMLNGRKTDVPSAATKAGDVIGWTATSKKTEYYKFAQANMSSKAGARRG